MKYTSFILVMLFAFSACKNEGNKEPNDNATPGTTQSTTAEQPASEGGSLDPNEIVKNNQSAGSDAKITADGSAAAISFETKEKDFGTITEGEQVEVTYKFKNSGGSDLVITNCVAGCGCTVPIWPKDPIKPGQSGVIKAKFDSNGRSGHNEKHVTVMSNATESTVELAFRGEVKPSYKK